MKKLLLFIFCIITLSFSISAQSVSTDQYNSLVPQSWFNLELYLILYGNGFTPPVAGRALGYTGLALYQATVGGMTDYSSFSGKLPGSPTFTAPAAGTVYNWNIVANNALADIIDSLYGNATVSQKDTIHTTKNNWNTQLQVGVSTQIYTDSRALGEQIARDVFAYSTEDCMNQAYLNNTDSSYVMQTCTACWVPTPPHYYLPVQPHWGSMRAWVAADSTSPNIPMAYPTFSTDTTSAFYAYASEVYETGKNLTQGQINIANYWADMTNTITTGGHSISILTQLLQRNNSNLEFASLGYSKLGMAIMEAFMACWKTKYNYALMRPITYIQSNIDSTWMLYLETPNFPEYTSGHSTKAGCVEAVMNNLFGANYPFIDSTYIYSFGGPRSYSSFQQAAYEDGLSRLYGGVHYEFSIIYALSLGNSVGNNILDLFETVHNTTGIDPTASSVNFSVYPNPTANFMLINSSERVKQIEVYDMQGKQVLISENPYVLGVYTLNPGDYVIKVLGENDALIATRQIVKQ